MHAVAQAGERELVASEIIDVHGNSIQISYVDSLGFLYPSEIRGYNYDGAPDGRLVQFQYSGSGCLKLDSIIVNGHAWNYTYELCPPLMCADYSLLA